MDAAMTTATLAFGSSPLGTPSSAATMPAAAAKLSQPVPAAKAVATKRPDFLMRAFAAWASAGRIDL
jgi:hypothetical protein